MIVYKLNKYGKIPNKLEDIYHYIVTLAKIIFKFYLIQYF